MKVYNHKDAYEHLKYIFKFQKEDCFIAVFTEPAVHYGEELWFNEDRAKELNLEMFNLHRRGGAIVTSPGDLVYCFFLKEDDQDLAKQLEQFLLQKIRSKGLNVALVDNDLLINGKKFYGSMKQDIGRMHFIGGHISINCNLELIQQICTKPMKKEPIGLGSFNITTQDVIEWINLFWFYYKK